MSTTVDSEYTRPIVVTSSPTAWPNNGTSSWRVARISCSTSALPPAVASTRRCVAQHLHRAGEARVGIRVRRHGARKREHRRARNDGARGPDRECDGIAREPRERAARHRADQRAAALQARHRRDRAAELVGRADVGEIRLAAEHPRRVPAAERQSREADEPRLRRDAEQA